MAPVNRCRGADPAGLLGVLDADMADRIVDLITRPDAAATDEQMLLQAGTLARLLHCPPTTTYPLPIMPGVITSQRSSLHALLSMSLRMAVPTAACSLALAI